MESNIAKDPINVIISGVGGQGNILLAYLLGSALIKKGYIVTIGETYGASQRGGSVVSHVRISKTLTYSPLTPHGAADLIVGLEPVETLRSINEWGNPGVIVVSNTRPIYPIDVLIGNVNYPTLNEITEAATQLSKRCWFIDASGVALELGAPVIINMVMAGASIAANILPLTREEFDVELRSAFTNEKYELNKKAFSKGAELIPI